LTSNAKVTLHILFKPVEEFSLLNKDKTFHMNYFKEILEKITHFSFCRGIRQKRGRRSDLTYFKYPFRRCQSENCLLWFKDKADSSVPKYPVLNSSTGLKRMCKVTLALEVKDKVKGSRLWPSTPKYCLFVIIKAFLFFFPLLMT
jgi:hypothetical protein